MTQVNLPDHIKDLIGAAGRFAAGEGLPDLADLPRQWAWFEATRAELSALVAGAFSTGPEDIYETAAITGGHALYLLTAVFGVRNGEALLAVMTEQQRQFQKFGRQDHAPAIWNLILAEEIGEAAKELYEHLFGDPEAMARLHTETTEVIAVVASMLESLKRNELNEVNA